MKYLPAAVSRPSPERPVRMLAVLTMIISCLLISPAQASFELKIPCPDDSSIEAQLGRLVRFYSSMQAFSNDKPRCILNQALIPASEVQEARLHNDPVTNDIIVDIIFSEAARDRLLEYTRHHIGQPIALMIEGMILTIPSIQAPIDQGLMQIHGLWYEDAVRLARSINKQ